MSKPRWNSKREAVAVYLFAIIGIIVLVLVFGHFGVVPDPG